MTPLLLTALLVGGCPDENIGYLHQPAFSRDECPRLPLRPYQPQPGEIMLATDQGIFWVWAHRIAGTGHPHHSGIVFQKPDGCMAILESGPYGTLRVRALDVREHLTKYEERGVWIRQRKVPLTPEQAASLSAFAMEQDGKRFSLVRLGGQITPFRARGPIKTHFMGGPHGSRRSYFCSELVTECLVAAGLLDPEKTRPSATYPRDLFYGRSSNPFINRNLDLSCWEAPARWTSGSKCCDGQ